MSSYCENTTQKHNIVDGACIYCGAEDGQIYPVTLNQEEVNELASVLAFEYIPLDKPKAKEAVSRIVNSAAINLKRPYRFP